MASTRKIAQQAGVSIGTVSRVLNNKAGVSEETRRRVLEVAQELNYAPHKRMPLSLVNVTHLGLLVRPMEPSLTSSPFYSDVYHGVEQVCRDLGISLTFSTLDSTDNRLRSLPALVRDERISGVVLVGALAPAIVEAVAAAVTVPMVLVDNWYPGCAWDAVMLDNAGGMLAATERLIALGHRSIVFVNGPDHPSIVERRAGYEAAMRRHDLPSRMVSAPYLGTEDGEAAADELVRRWPEASAILCSNDLQAIGVLKRLNELGQRVPDDFSLVGFDDISMASVTNPPLATVSVDRTAFGRLAVELLLGRVGTLSRPPVRCVMGVALKERPSLGRPRTPVMSKALASVVH